MIILTWFTNIILQTFNLAAPYTSAAGTGVGAQIGELSTIYNKFIVENG